MKKFKIFFILIIFSLFSNCGYEPVFSKNTEVNDQLLSISVINIKDRSGQILRNSLLDKINPEDKRVITKYQLEIKLNESKTELAYRQDMSATRSDLEIIAKYSLKNLKEGNVVLKGESKSISSFDVVESVYATLVAEKDAREKSLKILV